MDKLQWGNRKRLRCMKMKDSSINGNGKPDGGYGGGAAVVKKKITSRVIDGNNHNHISAAGRDAHHALPPVPSPLRSNRDLGMGRSAANDGRKASTSSSPEKEDRYYTTRGSGGVDDATKALFFSHPKEENKKLVWPKLLISLSSKEKEEDFMLMKGCKPPQRPKKRAKLIQKTILFVSPGAWLSDLCQERYEVREKKTSKKKPRGLKAMGTMESDSE